eukprot:380594-Pelagomonas_calceolata.AAC.10
MTAPSRVPSHVPQYDSIVMSASIYAPHYDSTGVSASILERAMHSVNDGLNAVGIGLHGGGRYVVQFETGNRCDVGWVNAVGVGLHGRVGVQHRSK